MISSCSSAHASTGFRGSEQKWIRAAVVYDARKPLVIEMPLEPINEAST
jgi:hypothetical protein